MHPKNQQDGLAEVLEQVGWVQQVIKNVRTGRLIDGHLRVELAQKHKEPTVPVVLVDLSEEEERLILATIDPIAGLAVPDAKKLIRFFQVASASPLIKSSPKKIPYR